MNVCIKSGIILTIFFVQTYCEVSSQSHNYRGVLFCFFNRCAIPVSMSVRESLLDLGISHLQMKFCGKVFALFLFVLY